MSTEITMDSVLAGRTQTYAMLARLFEKEIDADYLRNLRRMRCPINTGNEDVDRGYRLFHHYLSHVWERTLDDLSRDYLRTFIGANTTGHSAAYPNESVHTSPMRLVMQDARDEVMALYRAAGLETSKKWNAGEDHISLELTYMRIMSERAQAAYDTGERLQATHLLMTQYHFLMDHLQNWVPLLAKDMLDFAQTEFYQALAYLVRGYLDEDQAFLETVLEEEIAEERERNGKAADAEGEDVADAADGDAADGEAEAAAAGDAEAAGATAETEGADAADGAADADVAASTDAA